MLRRVFAFFVAGVLMLEAATPLAAQSLGPVDDANVWRSFAGKLEAGTPLKLRLRDGRSVKATFIEARESAMLVQPKSRIAVPVQSLAYDAIVAVEKDDRPSTNVGKAIGIGIASGVGTFLGILFFVAAAYD